MDELAQIPLWSFVAIASLSGTTAAMVATLFDGVRLGPGRSLAATAMPAFLALALVSGTVAVSFALWSVVLIVGLGSLALIDRATRTIPDMLSLPLIALGVVHALTAGAPAALFAGTALTIIALGVLVGRIWPRAGARIGGGDVLLLAAAAAWFGPAALPELVVAGGILLLLRIAISPVLPLGPATCVPVPDPDARSLPFAPAFGLAQLALWLGGPFL